MAARKGDTVFVHYTGTLDDGTEFDSSRGREALEFVLGGGMILPAFEAAVEGRDVGETLSISIEAKDAYGEHNPEMTIIVPRSEVPRHIEPEVGMGLQIALEEGELDVVISRVTDSEVELDGNHPLAGKRLNFVIEIMQVKQA
ncbi:peptidylprolyl isomerase [Desulfovibrio sp. OttesenSCG-928-A18]|nr:peptidylprolyl isomerase [Desulfovibrio sp. OttesenSCG-928-A18]